MAGAVVEFLVENLKQLRLHHAHLIPDEVEKLEKHLGQFKAFLKDASKPAPEEEEEVTELIRRIRSAVYEAGDIIDAYVTQAVDAKIRNYFQAAIGGPPNIVGIVQEFETLVDYIHSYKSRVIDFDFAHGKVEEGRTNEELKVRELNVVVGYEDEAHQLIGYLTQESDQLQIISIVGMPGVGKTSLARQIFRDQAIWYEFPTRIWVYVSQDFKKKDIFLAILEEFTILTEDIRSQTDQALADLVVSCLENERFLLVMDDVWSCEDWDKLQVALPKSNKMGSLERLEVLKLKDKAFMGETWEVSDGGFRHLEVLNIERTNLKIWLASHHHFPKLEHLRLKHCHDLEEIPMELADVPSFLKLDLFHSKQAAASALQIKENKRQDDQLISGNLEHQFKLSIFPWRNHDASF